MNNDIISRSELKKAFNKWWGCDDISVTVVEDLIDNAPTVEQKEFEQILQPIKVNIPEDIKGKLIEEMSKPRKVILDESKTVQDCIVAYGDGFESARRLFESKCRDCDFHKFTETFINNTVKVMKKNGIESVEQLSEILGKGNDND